jgi:hypothetical protein
MNPDAFFGDYIYRSTDESAQRASLRGFEILSPGETARGEMFRDISKTACEEGTRQNAVSDS